MPRRGVIRMVVLQSTVWILPAHIERCMAQETAPSLGDVARKERELKKNSTTSSGKKWTDEDISANVAPVYYPEVRASFVVPKDWTRLKRSAGTSGTSGHVSYSCAGANDTAGCVLQFSLGGYASPWPGSETAAFGGDRAKSTMVPQYANLQFAENDGRWPFRSGSGVFLPANLPSE